MFRTIGVQSRFYFRFILMLAAPEVIVAKLFSHQFLGFFAAAGTLVLILMLGVRLGTFRPSLARWACWCTDHGATECKDLLEACKKFGTANDHTTGFIERFESAWKLPKNRKARQLLAAIWLSARIGIWFMFFRVITFFATEYPKTMSNHISGWEKFTLATLMCTTVIVFETHRLGSREGQPAAGRDYLLAILLLLICIGAVSCEGLLHRLVGRPHISRAQLHLTHEIVIAAIAFLMMVYEARLIYREKKSLLNLHLWVHIGMLLVMVGWIYVEPEAGGWKAGRFVFPGIVSMQVMLHAIMYFAKEFKSPEPALPPSPPSSPQALARGSAV